MTALEPGERPACIGFARECAGPVEYVPVGFMGRGPSKPMCRECLDAAARYGLVERRETRPTLAVLREFTERRGDVGAVA